MWEKIFNFRQKKSRSIPCHVSRHTLGRWGKKWLNRVREKKKKGNRGKVRKPLGEGEKYLVVKGDREIVWENERRRREGEKVERK